MKIKKTFPGNLPKDECMINYELHQAIQEVELSSNEKLDSLDKEAKILICPFRSMCNRKEKGKYPFCTNDAKIWKINTENGYVLIGRNNGIERNKADIIKKS